MKPFIYIFFWGYPVCFLHAQSVSTLMGARQVGLGNASATISDEFSIHNNVAGIASLKKNSGGFAYEINPTLQGANRLAALFNITTKLVNTSIGIFRFGDILYDESKISFGLANQIGISSLGIRVNYIQYRADGWNTSTAFSVDFGGITQLTPLLKVGAHIVNITQTTLVRSTSEKLPTQLVLGLNITPHQNVLLTTEIEKDLNYTAIWRLGLEYNLYQKTFFRIGYNLKPVSLFGGIGIRKKFLYLDYAVRHLLLIGTSHQASVTYIINNRSSK